MGKTGMASMSPVQNAVVGMSAGCIEIVALQPMLYCKNATQQNLPLSLNPAVLYRGVVMSATNMSIITGVQFPLTGLISNAISGGGRKLTDGESLVAAFAGGTISAVICSPMELVMIQQQKNGGSIGHHGTRICGGGPSMLFRGLTPTMVREGIFTMGYMALGPVVSKKLTESTGVTGFAATFGGCSIAGVIAASLSHPFDTIKTVVQGDVDSKTYKGPGHAYKLLLEEGGPARFFSGWAWRTSRMIGALFIIGQVKVLLAPRLFPELFVEEDGTVQ
eukprot:m.419799 g.419799  ORF g.419799 m.419799 type:complete len:277 (-) comp31840_c0_seq1:277-1107(-)